MIVVNAPTPPPEPDPVEELLSESLSVNLTTGEKAQIRAEAKKAGTSMSALARKRITGK